MFKKAEPKAEPKQVTQPAEETAEAKPTLATKRAAAKRQFAKADAAADPTPEEATLGRAIRGY